jgi:putative PIG3 family NAD(P)H quinone oxidoreductase
MMRAVVITHAGDPDVLAIREVPEPVPGENQVLVSVRATALNRADILQRQGRYPPPAGAPPDIPGIEIAGEVLAGGPGASRWPRGTRVFGLVGGGAHAELVAADQNELVAIPDNLDWTRAAAVPEVFITAHDALVTQAGMHEGESVLIHAVGSGVGLAAVQLVRAWNARPFGTTRTASKLDLARELGMVDGITLSRDLSPLTEAVRRWTDGSGIDITLDLVGGPYLAASIKAAARRGRLMLVGTVAGATPDFPLGVVLHKRLTIRGTVLRSRGSAEKAAATQAFTRDVLPLLASGVIRPVVDCVLPMHRIADAHRRMESNESTGKIVLTWDSTSPG